MNANLDFLQKLVAADRDGVRSILAESAVDVRDFLSFARRHRLGSYCYWRLSDLGLAAALPVQLRIATKATALVDRQRNETLIAEMRAVSATLQARGASALFIKGPLFAQRYYGSLEARSVADLDILTRSQSDLDEVDRVLTEAGFRKSSRTPFGMRVSRLFAHHHEYRRGELPIDVHWELQRHFTFTVDYGRLWDAATTVNVGGSRVNAASDEYEIVLQILGVLTDLQVGKLTLRSMVDIVHLLRTTYATIDWPEFLAARTREHVVRPSAFVLRLALDFMHCAPEFPALERALAPHLSGLPPTSLAHRALLASAPLDLRQKLLALRIYETPLPVAVAWWAVSLPFRMMVYGVSQR